MRRRRLITVAVMAGCLAAPAALGAISRAQPSHLLVYAQEWSLWPSRASLPAGKLTVQLWNRGQDAHDIRIRRLDRRGRMTGPVQGMTVTQSGAINHANWGLKPGRYVLYCGMPGHFAKGMHTTLTVR